MSERCPVCGAFAYISPGITNNVCICPVCGKYEYSEFYGLKKFNLNHLGAYLAYNGFIHNSQEYRYFTTMSKDKCDKYRRDFENGDKTHGHPVHLSIENVENWYPKTFSEKIDYILLYLNNHIKHIGDSIKLEKEALFSSFFVDRYDYENGNSVKRLDNDMKSQVYFIYNYLQKENFIVHHDGWNGGDYDMTFTLDSKAYARIDFLQKNTSTGKNVLVAMQFGDDTKKLRESIRQGITDSGYIAIFIDEVQHNDFITPELLKYIKDSKFVVADLSHKNNGAYFEEGYAMGLGKPVIQLCKDDVKLHFDIAQKNTIMWENEQDIPQKLKNRIIATID